MFFALLHALPYFSVGFATVLALGELLALSEGLSIVRGSARYRQLLRAWILISAAILLLHGQLLVTREIYTLPLFFGWQIVAGLLFAPALLRYFQLGLLFAGNTPSSNWRFWRLAALPAADAPVFLMNHGGGGYSRLLLSIVPDLFARGYTVVLPDQRGQGYSGGDRGDFVINDFVADIVAAFDACCERFAGPIAIGGGSFGGALAYMAATAVVARADRGANQRRANAKRLLAVVCHNLFDLGDPRDALGLSHMAPLRNLPGFARGLRRALPASSPCALRLAGRFSGNGR